MIFYKLILVRVWVEKGVLRHPDCSTEVFPFYKLALVRVWVEKGVLRHPDCSTEVFTFYAYPDPACRVLF